MKTCSEYELAISCYVDGELDSADASGLFRHLGDCESCRLFLDTSIHIRMETAKEKLRDSAQDHSRHKANEPHGAAIVDHHSMARLLRKRISLPIPIAAVIALALIVASVSITYDWRGSTSAGVKRPTLTEQVATLPVVSIP